MNQATPNKLKPALIGGIAEGVASSVPLLNIANCAFCLLIVAGGVLAAYLYMKDAPPSAQAPLRDGLKLGLLVGLIEAVVFALISISMALLTPDLATWPLGLPPLEDVDLPPEVASILSSQVPLAIFFGLISLIIDPIFCGLGGLIGVAIFNKKPAASESSLDILKRRYALGEIDKDEYEARKKDLS